MVEVLPEGKRNSAEIQHFVVTEDQAKLGDLRAMINHRPSERVDAGQYAKLLVDGEIVMSDTRNERETNRYALRRLKGKVLIGGLGLGMLVKGLLAKEEPPKSILILEKNPDVINLVGPYIEDSRVTIQQADVLTWRRAKGETYDSIWMDIWNYPLRSSDPEVVKLKRKYSRMLSDAPKAWYGYWG